MLTVTLDRPEQRNAQTPATWRALAAIGAELPATCGWSCCGAPGRRSRPAWTGRCSLPRACRREPSLARWPRLDDAALDAAIAAFQEAFTWWSEVPAVTVAAVQGHAVGAGFQLALACDLRVLADDARLAMRETSLGLVPDLGGTSAAGRRRRLRPRAGDLRDRPLGRRGRGRRGIGLATAVVPRGGAGRRPSTDLVAALLAAPEGALRETLLLLRGAATRTPAGAAGRRAGGPGSPAARACRPPGRSWREGSPRRNAGRCRRR